MSDRPEVYDYIDKKFKELSRDFSNLRTGIADLNTNIKLINARERPAENCRKYVELRTSEAFLKSEENRIEYKAIAEQHKEELERKAGTAYMKTLIGGIAGAYIFTWAVFLVLKGSL